MRTFGRGISAWVPGLVAAWALLLGNVSRAGVLDVVYDPSLGTLPSDQGFTVWSHPVTGAPPLVVEDGVLKQDTRGSWGGSREHVQWFQGSIGTFHLEDGLVVHLDLKVVSSTYYSDGGNIQTAGYGVGLGDGQARSMVLGITDTGVFLDNGTDPASPLVAFDTTDAMHHYELSISASGAVLKIDDAPVVAIPLGDKGTPIGSQGFLLVGDLFPSGLDAPAESATELAYFRVTNVPEPSCMLAIGAAAVVLQRRKRRPV